MKSLESSDSRECAIDMNYEKKWVSKDKYDKVVKECDLWYKLWLEERYNRFLGLDK